MDDDIDTFLRAGADAVFEKPFRVEELRCLLRYIRSNGVLSQSHMKLVRRGDTLDWTDKWSSSWESYL
jgi:DNA-binding response OmpR family regulator